MAERKKPNRSGVSLGVYVRPAISQAFSDYVESAKPRVTKTAIIEMLLEQFLAEHGHWPPAEQPSSTRKRKSD